MGHFASISAARFWIKKETPLYDGSVEMKIPKCVSDILDCTIAKEKGNTKENNNHTATDKDRNRIGEYVYVEENEAESKREDTTEKDFTDITSIDFTKIESIDFIGNNRLYDIDAYLVADDKSSSVPLNDNERNNDETCGLKIAVIERYCDETFQCDFVTFREEIENILGKNPDERSITTYVEHKHSSSGMKH